MVGHLMVLGNPKKKRARKMTALQRKYFGKRRKAKGRAAPAKRKRRRTETVIVAASNPRRRSTVSRKRKAKASTKRRRRVIRARTNPKRRRFMRTRRNPRSMGGGIAGFMTNSLLPAAVGAAGALAVDVALGMMPLPVSLRTGTMLPVIRIGASLLFGALVGAVVNEETGEQVAAGGMIVTVYSLTRAYMQTNVPQVQLARYVAPRRMARYMGRNGMGNFLPRIPGQRVALARMNRQGRGLGYIGPARTMARYVSQPKRSG